MAAEALAALAQRAHEALPVLLAPRDLLVLLAPLVLTDLLVPPDLLVLPVPLVPLVPLDLPALPVRKVMTEAEPSV